MTLEEYLSLIPSVNRDKPKFIEMVTLNLAVPRRVQELLTAMIPLFDVDTAVGDQLDIIGKWVGVSRNVSVPIPGVYFEWDGPADQGWDYGSWAPADGGTEVTVLPDDAYRLLVKAKIAANRWDGTTEGAYDVWDQIFTSFTILIKDNQDMSYDLGFYGGTVDTLSLQLILRGYIPLKPEGVKLRGVFTPVEPDAPFFSWDTDSEFLKGWDEGSWANEYTV